MSARPVRPATTSLSAPPRGTTRRALQQDAKQARRTRILDAAEQVLLRAPHSDIAVADVADVARLAKGTVYLYFPSKDELLLALHERKVTAFFDALCGQASGAALDFERVFQLIEAHALASPLFLPLASRCLANLTFSVSAATRSAYRARIAVQLQRAGSLLEAQLRGLEAGAGTPLLFSTYALMMGWWQLLSPDPDHPYPFDFRASIEEAMRALWRGRITAP